ncbi:MAG: rhodanese-like domain-containing protein [Cytophagales bacterium]|nr:rhodanese-like domain-containing protein [Cytophagales bacterium]
MHLLPLLKKLIFQFSMGFTLTFSAVAQTPYDKLLDNMYKNTVPLIKPEELSDLMQHNESLVLLDIRSQKEYQVSHLANSMFIDYDSFNKHKISHLNKDANIIVYCAVGYRSERVGEKLLDMGFENVRNLYGGIFQWKNQDKPVVDTKGIKTDSVHTYSKAWSKWLKKGIKVYE